MEKMNNFILTYFSKMSPLNHQNNIESEKTVIQDAYNLRQLCFDKNLDEESLHQNIRKYNSYCRKNEWNSYYKEEFTVCYDFNTLKGDIASLYIIIKENMEKIENFIDYTKEIKYIDPNNQFPQYRCIIRGYIFISSKIYWEVNNDNYKIYGNQETPHSPITFDGGRFIDRQQSVKNKLLIMGDEQVYSQEMQNHPVYKQSTDGNFLGNNPINIYLLTQESFIDIKQEQFFSFIVGRASIELIGEFFDRNDNFREHLKRKGIVLSIQIRYY